MRTLRNDTTARHHHTSQGERHMQHIELRLADAQERQALYRQYRDADRAAIRQTRTLRHHLGESLVRLGRRVGGDVQTTPAWQR